MMNLFQQGDFQLHSGPSWFKIECDVLTRDDWATAARLIVGRVAPFGRVEGVPRGGLALASELAVYSAVNAASSTRSRTLLIVDDVWTTGASMEAQRAGREAIGAVLFARTAPAAWVTPVFTMVAP